jgi:hypothetical protein
MIEKKCRLLIILGFCFFNYTLSIAQPGNKRIQYPAGLKNAYFGFNLGYIQYPFSSAQLEPGFTVESVKVPHIAPRFILYGYQFNKYLGAQISYMRPVDWISYQDINGDKTGHSVWMNVGGLTLVSRIPLAKKISISAEAGLGVITRKGFYFSDTAVVKDAVYATGLFGGALQYHVNKKWDLQAGITWSPAHKKEKQPQTLYYSAGFNYHLEKLSTERVDMVRKTGSHFPSQLLQLTLTTNAFGYFVNDLFSKTLPVFWGGAAHLQRGISVNYQRNLFHTRKIFSLDWGAGVGFWRSKKQEDDFFTLSLYPVLRFTPIRSAQADFFFEYTVAGPTYISRTIIDNEETGRHFTFYDAMGIGVFAGRKKQLNAGIRIAHFSNGNIFPRNNGVKVPLSFSLGYAFR